MSDTPAHPMESAIVDALTQGLEALPVSLPPESEVLAAASDPGAPVPSAAAMAGVAEFVGGPETGARRGFSALLSNRWAYVGAAVVVLAATIGIGAGLQFHQGGAQGSASNNRPAAPAPSGGGSQPVGGVPSSTPLATATPPSVTPPPTAVATPLPRTPVPAAPRRPSTPVPTAPPATPVPASTPAPATAAPSTPAPTAAPAAATPAPTPTPRPTPCLIRLGRLCV